MTVQTLQEELRAAREQLSKSQAVRSSSDITSRKEYQDLLAEKQKLEGENLEHLKANLKLQEKYEKLEKDKENLVSDLKTCETEKLILEVDDEVTADVIQSYRAQIYNCSLMMDTDQHKTIATLSEEILKMKLNFIELHDKCVSKLNDLIDFHDVNLNNISRRYNSCAEELSEVKILNKNSEVEKLKLNTSLLMLHQKLHDIKNLTTDLFSKLQICKETNSLLESEKFEILQNSFEYKEKSSMLYDLFVNASKDSTSCRDENSDLNQKNVLLNNNVLACQLELLDVSNKLNLSEKCCDSSNASFFTAQAQHKNTTTIVEPRGVNEALRQTSNRPTPRDYFKIKYLELLGRIKKYQKVINNKIIKLQNIKKIIIRFHKMVKLFNEKSRFNESLRVLMLTKDAEKALYGAESREVVLTLGEIVDVLCLMGRRAEALSVIETAAATSTRSLGENSEVKTKLLKRLNEIQNENN